MKFDKSITIDYFNKMEDFRIDSNSDITLLMSSQFYSVGR